MNYKEKLKYAESAVEDILTDKPLDTIKEELKAKGLLEVEVSNVMKSANNMLGDKLGPEIRTKLLAHESIDGITNLDKLDKEIIDGLIQREQRALVAGEQKKLRGLLQSGASPEDIYSQINQDFYPKALIDEQISNHQAIEKEKSPMGRMLNIGGGLAIIAVTAIIFFTSGRLFYVLPIIGLGLIVKGIFTEL